MTAGMTSGHRQRPVDGLGFAVDEDIVRLIGLMNACGVETVMSCQDNNGYRGSVRRIWVEMFAEDLEPFLALLDRPGEVEADLESLSNRIAAEYEPPGWEAFREDRAWHYAANVGRLDGVLLPLTVGVRFPFTDLGEVVRRLEMAHLDRCPGIPPR